jgi:hypothetical protein
MDELVCEATSGADDSAVANLSRNGGITVVATTLSKESRKERRFMAREDEKDWKPTLSQLCFIESDPEHSPAQKFH